MVLEKAWFVVQEYQDQSKLKERQVYEVGEDVFREVDASDEAYGFTANVVALSILN